MTSYATTYLLTGASSGLGLAAARLLASDASRRLILPVRSAARGEALRAALGATAAPVETPIADLESLAKISALADALAGRPIDGPRTSQAYSSNTAARVAATVTRPRSR